MRVLGIEVLAHGAEHGVEEAAEALLVVGARRGQELAAAGGEPGGVVGQGGECAGDVACA